MFFTFFAGPAFFSEEMAKLLPRAYAGAVAQIIIKRYFLLHILCAAAALAHLGAACLYAGRPVRKTHLGGLIALLVLGLVGRYWLVPHMEAWHFVIYSGRYTAAQIVDARRSFGMWHGVTQTMNLVMMAGLLLHLFRTEKDNQVASFISSGKFRG